MDPNLKIGADGGKREYFTGSQKRRLKKMMNKGVDYRQATKLIQEEIAQARKPVVPPVVDLRARYVYVRPVRPTNTSNDQECTASTTSNSPSTSNKVAICHRLHPAEKLSEELIDLVNRVLLVELDKAKIHNRNLGFGTGSVTNGGMYLTCLNRATYQWLIETLERVKPILGDKIELSEGDDVLKIFIFSTYIPPEDAMSVEVLKKRLAKQNFGLKVERWQILHEKMKKNGGVTYTFATDKGSKDFIMAEDLKLCLNLSRIHVRRL